VLADSRSCLQPGNSLGRLDSFKIDMPRAIAPEETTTTSWPCLTKSEICLAIWLTKTASKLLLPAANKLEPILTTTLLYFLATASTSSSNPCLFNADIG